MRLMMATPSLTPIVAVGSLVLGVCACVCVYVCDQALINFNEAVVVVVRVKCGCIQQVLLRARFKLTVDS